MVFVGYHEESRETSGGPASYTGLAVAPELRSDLERVLEQFLLVEQFKLERIVAEAPPRGIAIARGFWPGRYETVYNKRVLATVIPNHPDAAAIAAEARETHRPIVFSGKTTHVSGEPYFFLAEELPEGFSSTDRTWDEKRATLFRPWGVALAQEIQRLELRAHVFHLLRPELVMVSASPPYVHAIAERSGRLTCLRRPRDWNPDDAPPPLPGLYEPEGIGPSLVNHVFFLAGAVWRWKHGHPPFPATPEGLFALRAGVPLTPAADALDRLLVECFRPRGTERPGIRLVIAALGQAN